MKYGKLSGKEGFILGGKPTGDTIESFWSWAYSELESNIVRSVLAEYIVASALGITDKPGEDYREMWRPYDLLYGQTRIEIKSASTIQAWNTKHKGRFTFSIAPARVVDEYGNYRDDAPSQRNSDIYVFCIFAPEDEDTPPLVLDAWKFYVIKTSILDDKLPTQKTISFEPLKALGPVETDYKGLKAVIDGCKE